MRDWKATLAKLKAEVCEGEGHPVQYINLPTPAESEFGMRPHKQGGLPLLGAGGLIKMGDGLVFNRELWNRQQEARRILALIPHHILVIGWKVMHEAMLTLEETNALTGFRAQWEEEHSGILMPWEKRRGAT